ncbi:hypothetical protein KGF86_06965 [Ornithinibacillus massiliensis]|uniref:Uncharacterized protein n=1 Tax=Ornithinibacillus massiliensis TaxID=1944633 RepID=A0ABS5MCZ0_9BACI|nr:hypothetical protein [Ornithinibacillus massiliensis]MBS3679948.1 hypothetical protein [Ornithinibacillus massiliensis]
MILSGDTVRLQVQFKTFTGQAIDPTDITLSIYDSTKQQIEQFKLDDTNKNDVGVYYFDYVTPDDKQDIIFEFKGVHNNLPIVVRDSLKIKFN